MKTAWLVVCALLVGGASCKSERTPAAKAAGKRADAAVVAPDGGPGGSGAGPKGGPGGPDAWLEPQPAAFPEVAVARGARGMVVTEAPLATKVGVAVLGRGGNAVDAAVAVAFAMAVVHPMAGNLGGGGFAVTRLESGKVVALDFRETAPAAATGDMYLDKDGKVGPDSLLGARAAGVPGQVAGLWALHEKHGSLPWKDLVEPAVALARDGFVVGKDVAEAVAQDAGRLGKFASSAELLLPGGKPLAAGTTWKNPMLARTLAGIATGGATEFYDGNTAALIIDEMQRSGGIITRDDLRGYRAVWREPIAFSYRGHRIYSMPPPSSGGVILAMVAGMLDGYDLAKMGWHSPDAVHVLIEAWRRAFAARNEYLGDPDFVKDMPLARLVSAEHAAALRKSIDPAHASSSSVTPALLEGAHTTHFAVVDDKGMAVALTTTLNTSFGSALVVSGAGFLLNNEMDDFASKPGVANAYGLVQGTANRIEPGKRMLSSMSPTIVCDAEGKPVMVVGAAGGSRIPTAVFQMISHVLDYGFDVGKAVGARRVHHQHLPDVVVVEAGALTREAWDALGARGHTLSWAKWPIAVGPAIVRQGTEWTGAVDPRDSGLALGY